MALPTILVNSATGSDTQASGAGPTTALTGTAASFAAAVVVGDTATALGVGSINLGHATDTTLTRTGAGAVAVEGKAIYITDATVIAASLFWETPTNKTLTFSAKASFAFTLNQIRGLKTSAGTLTLSVKINGTDVTGLASLSVTSSAQYATATAANAVAAGDRITVVIASVSSAADLEFTLKGTR